MKIEKNDIAAHNFVYHTVEKVLRPRIGRPMIGENTRSVQWFVY